MAKKVTIEINYKAVGQLLKSATVENALNSLTGSIASRLGNDYQTDSKVMGTRVISSVYTEEQKAIQDNLENNTMLKGAIG